MKTQKELLQERLNKLKSKSIKFLEKHSSIINKRGEYIPSFSGNHIFADLSIKGTQVQKEIYEKFNNISNEIEVILCECPEQYLNDYEKNKKKILVLIEQEGRTWEKSIDECIEEIKESFDSIISLLDKLFGIENNKSNIPYILVPDTNALLFNPDIEKWTFNDISSFKIALTPIIIEELDKLKVNHNNQKVKSRSKKIINKIKEYRRRGKLTDGVNIVNNKIKLYTVAKEPNMEQSLSWLNKDNNDDIFIASTIEITRKNLNSAVILVTADINLQNKCEFANIPFLEPPK